MNMVVVRHPESTGRYLFKVPEDVTFDAGTLVMCETCRGEQPGVCVTASFNAVPEEICKLWGTSPKQMKRILAYMLRSELEWPDEPKQESPVDDDAEP